MDLGHWEFNNEFDINDWFGFIYRIIEIDTGKEYIGKKQFFTTQRKIVQNRKNRKIVKKESNWKTYTSSSTHVNNAIELKGKNAFRFIIESLHKSKASLTYAEVQAQIFEDVLRTKLNNGEQKYYNRQIGSIKFIPPEEHTDETKIKISNRLKEKYKNSPYWKQLLNDDELHVYIKSYYSGNNHYLYRLMSEDEREQFITDHFRNENNPQFGKIPYNKGKTFEEVFGEEKAKQIKKILSEKCSRSGSENGMYGKTHSTEQKERWRTDERRIHHGENNGMYGKPCYYKMTEEEKIKWKENISKAGKGKAKPKEECIYCKKLISKNMLNRYHNENCKSKPTFSG